MLNENSRLQCPDLFFFQKVKKKDIGVPSMTSIYLLGNNDDTISQQRN